MDFHDALEQRHSVRSCTASPLTAEERSLLGQEIARSNETGNLHMRLVVDEPEAFSSLLAHYGKFRNVSNYLVLAGTPAPSLEQRCGYFGERIVLAAQELGLSSCWVGGTFKRRLVNFYPGRHRGSCLVRRRRGCGAQGTYRNEPAELRGRLGRTHDTGWHPLCLDPLEGRPLLCSGLGNRPSPLRNRSTGSRRQLPMGRQLEELPS